MEQIGVASGGHPNLNLSTEEKRLYTTLLKEADPDGFGAVSGDVAVKFFERTKLPPEILGQIWQIADTENRGFLTPAGFGVVLRLIAHAQAGRQPSMAVASQIAPLPKFDPIPGQVPPPAQPIPPPIQPITQQNTSTPSSPTSGPPPVRVPALSPEKVAEYSGLFEKSGAENGMLSGFVAKQIFERARLPNDVLGRIWGLADTQGRGALDVSEFVIAMHLLASYKSGAMRGVPNTLPPGLLDAASRRAPSRLSGGLPPGRPTSSAGPPLSQPQYAVTQSGIRPQSPLVNRQMAGTPLSAQSTGEPWLINAADKTRFDSIFATVDTANQGFVSGEQAVGFFGNARLPEEVLAQIWDLADINSDGVLNRDEFAVAMYLIRQHRGSRDGRVPNVLPAGLVPPSMRRQQQPSVPANIPVFDEAPVTKPRSAADDLFGLDVSEQPPPQQPPAQQFPQSTGSTDAGPFANSASAPPPTTSPPPSTLFKPFVPSSNFGQGLVPQATGAAAQSQTKEASLMDDEDDVAPAKINNEAAELGNLSNQVGNLSKQMQDVSAQRVQAEQQLSQTNQQKQAFQQRLAQLRAAYDQEVTHVKSLKDQLAASQAETKKVQQEMAMIEGTHADLQTQHQQLASALAADQQENATLKEKIRQTNTENEQLKPQLEKLKSDARQQKGLVAINKKQLATNEAERERMKAEMAAAQQELEAHRRETEETARQLEQSQRELEQARQQPLPTPVTRELSPPPQVASPTPSMSSNPFFRNQDSGAVFSPPMGSAISSPVPQQEHDRNSAFDAIFGPSLGSSAPAPTTSFGGEAPQFDESDGMQTPSIVEPPAPRTADQLESSDLPMRRPLLREESVSSSVKVAAPVSRNSPAQTPRALTPDTSTASPSSHRADDPFTSSAVDEEQESVRQTLPRGDTAQKLETLPGAFPGSRSETPAPSNINPAAIAIGAGAATIAAGAGIAAAVDNEQKQAEPAADPKDNFDDFFGGPGHKKTLSEQHADFDSAFASMDNSRQAPNGRAETSHHEFPAIQELEPDDESSDDDSEPRGFDDNFASPKSNVVAGKQPELAPGPALAPPPMVTQASSASLPDFTSQQPPPDYKDAVPQDNTSHFPMEYKNLLPAREDPTSPPPTAGGSAHPGPNPAGAPPAYGPEIGSPSGTSRKTSQVEATAPPPTKAAPFDFDSAFENMGQAPVADESDSDYDDTTPPAHQRSQATFDPSFDSPALSTGTIDTTPAPYSAHNAVTMHDAVTSPTSAVSNGTTTTSPTYAAHASFRDFDEYNGNPFPPSRTGTQQTMPPVSATSNNAVSHDWDELFRPLNQNAQAGAQAPPTIVRSASPEEPLTQTVSPPRPTEIAPGQRALTTDEEVRDLTPPQSTTNIPQTSITPSSPIATANPAPSVPARPQPGRALSAGTEHDDPILKRLTAMGWSREASLDALEKFDYNIDKAADYLTFSS
ncbi:hypothetical protein LTS08_005019 [Lithohypha guttulata]|nr:hypothetical protein LTS08_005019 [Lithohypha guttulata]